MAPRWRSWRLRFRAAMGLTEIGGRNGDGPVLPEVDRKIAAYFAKHLLP